MWKAGENLKGSNKELEINKLRKELKKLTAKQKKNWFRMKKMLAATFFIKQINFIEHEQ